MLPILKFLKKNSPSEIIIASQDQPNLDYLIDTSKPIKKGLIVVGLSFFIFLFWATFAPLDSGSPTIGTLAVDSKNKIIQHLSGGVVSKVLVKEGDHVKENQIMVKLLSTVSDSQLKILKGQENQLKSKLKSLKPLVDEGFFPTIDYQDIAQQYYEVSMKIKIAQEEVERTEVRSPIDGFVIGMQSINEGSIIQPGARLLSVVPKFDDLVVEVNVPPNLIDKITTGLDADVRFSSLNQRITPTISGKVVWVSADRISTQNSNLPIPMDGAYTARIKISKDALKALGDHDLKAGMPVDVIIKTGSRTFMSYLLKPFLDRVALSLKEQ